MSRFSDAADGIAEEARCSFGEYLDALSLEERADLEALMQSQGYQYVLRLIAQLDHRRFSKGTISAHDRGNCRCPGS